MAGAKGSGPTRGAAHGEQREPSACQGGEVDCQDQGHTYAGKPRTMGTLSHLAALSGPWSQESHQGPESSQF